MKTSKKILEVGNIKFDEPNRVDRLLDRLFLWIIPSFARPNHLTLLRYLMVPIVFYFVLFESYLSGFIFFCLAVFTDALDGALARTRGMITDWGKLHDPLADKLLIGISGAVLVTRYIGVEIILTIIFLEFLTVISAIHLHNDKEKEIGARLPGKIKMICQSLGIGLLFLFGGFSLFWALSLSEFLLYLAIIFSIFNFLIYRAL